MRASERTSGNHRCPWTRRRCVRGGVPNGTGGVLSRGSPCRMGCRSTDRTDDVQQQGSRRVGLRQLGALPGRPAILLDYQARGLSTPFSTGHHRDIHSAIHSRTSRPHPYSAPRGTEDLDAPLLSSYRIAPPGERASVSSHLLTRNVPGKRCQTAYTLVSPGGTQAPAWSVSRETVPGTDGVRTQTAIGTLRT